MGFLFDNVGITAQASSAAAGRLDSQQENTLGGAGPRGIVQNWSFGSSKQDTSQDTSQGEDLPWWTWLLVGLGALLIVMKIARERT